MRTVVFVRHGEAGHNVIEEFVHRPDNPLTPHGRAQAQVVNTFLKESTIGQSDELTF
jgi:broad specificity phosphatase PhoE